MVNIQATPKFLKLAKKAMTEEALQGLVDELTANPYDGSLIPGGEGIRKIRWATGKGGGKRGGVRIIYYYDGRQIVLLLLLYKKADQEDIDKKDLVELNKLIGELLG